MKLLPFLSFSLLLSFSKLFSQEIEKIKLVKEYNESDFYPHIEGYFDGRIPVLKLGSLEGIQTKSGLRISSFEISFITGRDYESFKIKSNQIPDTVFTKIIRSSLDERIFFTNIEAYDELNTRHILKSMSLIPFKDEE
jgi:hypothetical protein